MFCKVLLHVVLAKARSDGFLAGEADVQLLLTRCNLTLESAIALPRKELYANVAPAIAADARLVSAAAAACGAQTCVTMLSPRVAQSARLPLNFFVAAQNLFRHR
eukprot:5523339-Prymnesium_polylepis.1